MFGRSVVDGRIAVRLQTVRFRTVAHDDAEERDDDKDQETVREQNDAPAVRCFDLRVQYDNGGTEDRAGDREPDCETALAAKPARDNHRPRNRMTDAGCADRQDYEGNKKHDDSLGESQPEEPGGGDHSAPENQFACAEPI